MNTFILLTTAVLPWSTEYMSVINTQKSQAAVLINQCAVEGREVQGGGAWVEIEARATPCEVADKDRIITLKWQEGEGDFSWGVASMYNKD